MAYYRKRRGQGRHGVRANEEGLIEECVCGSEEVSGK